MKPEVKFDLPWPDKRLSPNARVHFMVRARATKAARHTAYVTLRHAMPDARIAFMGCVRVGVRLEFVPPDNRRRDGHNLAGSLKAGIDGIADAICIDDSRFVVSHELTDEVIEGGLVRVTVWGLA